MTPSKNPGDEPVRTNTYMYGPASLDVEKNRLYRLNELYNPKTMYFLTPYISGSTKILEVGCGTGLLATEVLKLADAETSLVAVDRDPYQIETTKKNLSAYINQSTIMLDLTDRIDSLKNTGPFDLIYCRWFLVHFPEPTRVHILQKLFTVLSPTGTFICDECDNSSVKYVSTGSSTSDCGLATQRWHQISSELMKKYGTDYQLTPDKLTDQMLKASDGVGKVELLGNYQLTFKSERDKSLISDGFRSSETFLFESMGQSIEELIAPFDDCARDEHVEAQFLRQYVVSFSPTPNNSVAR